MATMTERATITVPADYLEDARSALIREIKGDCGGVRTNQAAFMRDQTDVSRQDRDSSLRILRRDMRLLDELLNASDDTELTAEHDTTSSPLIKMLEEMVRLFTKRLREQMQYSPLDMGAVLDLTARLRWATDEALRIEPALDPRTTAARRWRDGSEASS